MIILISVTMGGNSKTAKKKLKAAADVTKISTKLGKVIKQVFFDTFEKTEGEKNMKPCFF